MISLKGDYRYEQKYLIKKTQHIELRQILSTMMEQDKHAGETGECMIRGLYFNDMYRNTYREKSDGVYARKEYRVRMYNCEDAIIHLECKYKQGAYIFEESVPLRREEYDNLLASSLAFPLKREEPIVKGFFVDARTALLRPKVVVDYERELHVYDAGTVRIIFDKEVRVGRSEDDILDDKIPAYGVLRPDEMILEIRFTGYLPERVHRLSYVSHFAQTSALKYCPCADKIREYR